MEEIKHQYLQMREKYNYENSLQAQVFRPKKNCNKSFINPENY